MTAGDVIDPINALPQSERAKGHDFVHALGAGRPPGPEADERAFGEAAQWVLAEHADLMRKLAQ